MRVAIVDYGTGNLHSLQKALESRGSVVAAVCSAADAVNADAIVLPGVGSFHAAASRIAPDRQLLRDALTAGLPCLGICLGMQLLYERSDEGPGDGIGVLPGRVRRLNAARVPHMGWNDVEPSRRDPLFDGLEDVVAYYANSFVVEPDDDADVIASTSCGVDRFPAAVHSGGIWGVQFHPEKSGAAGHRMIGNFLDSVRRT